MAEPLEFCSPIEDQFKAELRHCNAWRVSFDGHQTNYLIVVEDAMMGRQLDQAPAVRLSDRQYRVVYFMDELAVCASMDEAIGACRAHWICCKTKQPINDALPWGVYYDNTARLVDSIFEQLKPPRPQGA